MPAKRSSKSSVLDFISRKKHSAVPAAARPAATPAAAAAPVPAVADRTKLDLLIGQYQKETDHAARRSEAVWALGQLGDVRALETLVGALRDPAAEVARDAAGAMGALKSAAAVESLVAVLDNADGYFHAVVRSAAAQSLGQIGDVRAVDGLIRALRDPIAGPSLEAARALGALGDARAVKPLQAVAANADHYFLPIVQKAAGEVVAKLLKA